jgi:hypothetical protein
LFHTAERQRRIRRPFDDLGIERRRHRPSETNPLDSAPATAENTDDA